MVEMSMGRLPFTVGDPVTIVSTLNFLTGCALYMS